MSWLLVWLTVGSLFSQSLEQNKNMRGLEQLSTSLETLVEHVGPAVVQIFATSYAPGDAQTAASILTRQESSGSGVILDPAGYIITNAHVVEGARRVEVLLAGHVRPNPRLRSVIKPRGIKVAAKVLGIDRETDLALLKIPRGDCPYLRLGNSDDLRQGQLVLAFGSPLGLENSVSMGVISSIARQLRPEDPMVYIQTDASINPGSSGGPLVNTAGEVVGINTMIFSQSGGNEGIGFAAPSNIVKNVYEQLKTRGRVRRGTIGVSAQTITPVMATALHLPQSWGVILGDVFPGGPAFQAGLRPGDIIFTLNGKLMENGRQFTVNLYRYGVGQEVMLEVIRDSSRVMVKVPIIERENDPGRFLDLVDPRKNLISPLGILAVDIDRRILQMLPPLRKQMGVLVAAISSEAEFREGGFRAGDVIYSVNGVGVTGVSSLRSVLAELASGDAVAVQIQRGRRLMYLTFELL